MIVFAAGTFCFIPITFAALAFSHILSETAVEYILWALRLLFIASPFVALFLGLRGALAGTRPLPATERDSSAAFRILPLVVIVIGMLFGVGAWIAFMPQPGRPNIAIAFLGYTTDATGARLAKIAVTNLNATTIRVYQPRIELQAPADPRGYEDYFSGANFSWGSMLDKGESGSLTIPPPTNQLPWRLSFNVYPDQGKTVKNTIKTVVSISCLSVGLWPLFAKYLPLDGAFRMPYNIEGDWIKNAQ
jgi:hypothetical protein